MHCLARCAMNVHVEAYNSLTKQLQLRECDLCECDLNECDLCECDLKEYDLCECDLNERSNGHMQTDSVDREVVQDDCA